MVFSDFACISFWVPNKTPIIPPQLDSKDHMQNKVLIPSEAKEEDEQIFSGFVFRGVSLSLVTDSVNVEVNLASQSVNVSERTLEELRRLMRF